MTIIAGNSQRCSPIPGKMHRDRRSELLQRVTEDLASIPGLTFRVVRNKLIRTTISDPKLGVTPLHKEILRLLDEEDTLCYMEIGKRLQIAKAQMTKLIDKLVALNIVEKKVNQSDRRFINISLTEYGRSLSREHKDNLLNAIEMSMSRLSDEELAELSSSIRKIQEILSKLE